MRLNGIAFRLASLTLLVSTIIIAAIVGYNYTVSRRIIVELAEDRGTLLAGSTAQNISNVLNSVQKVTESIAFSLEDGTLSQEKLYEIERRVLAENPEIYGATIAFEPYAFWKESKYFAPHHFRSSGRIARTNLGGEDYQYFYKDWYQLAKELKHSIWTEPYFGESIGQELKSTYSVPFYRKNGSHKELAGVITADLSLTWMQNLLSQISKRETGYIFLLSRYGTYIAHPDESLVMNETIFTNAETLDIPQIREVGRRMVKGESGVVEIANLPLTGDSFLYFSPLPDQQWSIGVVFPKDAMLADVYRLNKDVATLGGVGFFALALMIIFLSGRITQPLRKLTASANDMASGNLDIELPEVVSRDEVGELTHSFQTMRQSLKEYIANLTETTAAKNRIESELRIAHDIQMGILPKLFPAFPERNEFDIYAAIEPAKEVGGDLYDFFFVDEEHFCVVVGDVSGKGVPAAFFMAVTKTLLKVIAEGKRNPGEVLAKVNNDLSEGNDSCMFVTLFLAIINIKSGELQYASAGHNPPLLIPKNKQAEWIPPLNELVAGFMEGASYTTKTLCMNPGDTLFIYTDGVTEAMDEAQTLYSEDRLLSVINDCGECSAEEIIHNVNSSIKAFTGGAEQSDDITMVAMQFLGQTNGR